MFILFPNKSTPLFLVLVAASGNLYASGPGFIPAIILGYLVQLIIVPGIVILTTYKLLSKNLLFGILSAIVIVLFSFTATILSGLGSSLFITIPLLEYIIVWLTPVIPWLAYVICGYLFFLIKPRLLGIVLTILFILISLISIYTLAFQSQNSSGILGVFKIFT